MKRHKRCKMVLCNMTDDLVAYCGRNVYLLLLIVMKRARALTHTLIYLFCILLFVIPNLSLLRFKTSKTQQQKQKHSGS